MSIINVFTIEAKFINSFKNFNHLKKNFDDEFFQYS